MKKLGIATAALLVVVGLVANLEARPQYNKQFETVVKGNAALAKTLANKSNCNVCHVGAKSKKNRNDFGKAVEEAIKAKDVKDAKKISEAFAAAAEQKVPGDGEQTFGDLIKAGKLPITKAEPKE